MFTLPQACSGAQDPSQHFVAASGFEVEGSCVDPATPLFVHMCFCLWGQCVLCMCVQEKGREKERDRERERVCVCTYVCVCARACGHALMWFVFPWSLFLTAPPTWFFKPAGSPGAWREQGTIPWSLWKVFGQGMWSQLHNVCGSCMCRTYASADDTPSERVALWIATVQSLRLMGTIRCDFFYLLHLKLQLISSSYFNHQV
jgi:hypothetical protein